MATAMLTTRPKEGNMFTLAANLAANGFIVRNGQAFAAQSVHAEKRAIEERVAKRRAEGWVVRK